MSIRQFIPAVPPKFVLQLLQTPWLPMTAVTVEKQAIFKAWEKANNSFKSYQFSTEINGLHKDKCADQEYCFDSIGERCHEHEKAEDWGNVTICYSANKTKKSTCTHTHTHTRTNKHTHTHTHKQT